ncbi:MAG: VWA domain-containing protein, partial [Pseudomonas capeferrum]
MIELWPQWLRPLWLLVVPLLGWLLFKLWHRRKRAGRWQMILPPAFHAVLLGGGSGSTSKLPWVVLGLAWALVVMALLGPSWQRVEENRQRPADPLVILLELTPQMLAEDSPPNRLEQARRKVLDLLEHRHDSQTALIVYAGTAHTLVPLSDDLGTTRNLLEAIDPSIMPKPGQRADLAVQKGLALLAQSGLGQGRLLLIGSSLSAAERQGIVQALGRQGPSLLMLGIGSRDGAPVRQANGEFLKDDQGGILLPRLDSASLKAFVSSTGGRYRNARVDDLDLRGLGLFDNPRALRNDGQTLQLDSWADQVYWLLIPLLLLAACAGRRGWLFCLPRLLALPQPSQAFEFKDL